MDDKCPRTISSQPSSSHPKTQSKASQRQMTSKTPPSERTGAAIMNSDDPSSADLRAWAEDKQKHYPGEDGSIAVNNATMSSMAWGGPWILPHKRGILRPPDERVSYGEARYMGPAGGEGEGSKEAESPKKKKKLYMLSGLFRAKGKSVEAGNGDDNIIR
ncbi:hypothetical protein JMJ35_006417 [Cladonia borealis]|uniref:Uncharacterized protein n=1 Tax=Cladonia borealis TaxID=184061 RepID=A0AA39QX76_9LECA|nr:hypothetical protein JMJ35_006417 [Cladonia borealis]